MQAEDQLVWLIQLLRNQAQDFQALYNIQFFITDIIILKAGDPKFWFCMNDQNHIRQRSEDWLKQRIISLYFRYPNITLDELNDLLQQDQPDNINQESQVDLNQTLFFFEQKISKSKIYRRVTKGVAQELFKNPNEKIDIMNNWTKILGDNNITKDKHLQLFIITLHKDFMQTKTKYTIDRKKIHQPILEKEEFTKQEQGQKKVVKVEEQIYKSLAQGANEMGEKFVQSLCRFIEGKLQKIIAVLQIEFFVNGGSKIYLSGLEKIQFYNAEQQIETLDLFSLSIQKNLKQNFWSCPGLYCDQARDNPFYDENDEQFCLFIVADDKKEEKLILYKSILLDMIERYKVLIKIQEQFPQLSDAQLKKIPESVLFKLRKLNKFTPLEIQQETHNSNIQKSEIYMITRKFASTVTMFIIKQMLQEMKQLLTLNISDPPNKKQKNYQQYSHSLGDRKIYAKQQLELQYIKLQYFQANNQVIVKNRMSSKFFEKLKTFDVDKLKFFNEFTVTQSVDDKYFQRGFGNYKIQKNFFMTQQQQESNGFQLPTIRKVELRDKQNLIKKKTFIVNKDQVESLGLKHYLGHVKNLPYSDQGLAISKSSLELNKLQDKIREIEKLKKKMEFEKVKKIREEIEIMMCTYYGNGKQNQDRLIDFVDTLKKRTQLLCVDEEEKSISKDQKLRNIQIVTDKNDFLTENQRRQKQDKEKKEIEIQETKKNFLEINGQLAQSILKKKPEQEVSVQKELDNITEDSELY